MNKKPIRALKAPKGVDPTLFRRSVAKASAKLKRKFAISSAQFALVNQLKYEAAKRQKPRGWSENPQELMHAKAAYMKLTKAPRLTPYPPGTPPPPFGEISTAAPPFNYPFPVGQSAVPFPAGIQYTPNPKTPNANTGQCGCNLVSYGAEHAGVLFNFGSSILMPQAGTYRITAYATISGFYYVYSPSIYQIAAAELIFGTNADDYDFAPDYDPGNSTALVQADALASRDWNFFSGQYNVSATFPVGDPQAYYVISMGLRTNVYASGSAVAGLSYSAVVSGIEVDII